MSGQKCYVDFYFQIRIVFLKILIVKYKSPLNANAKPIYNLFRLDANFWNILKKLILQGHIFMAKFTQSLLSKVCSPGFLSPCCDVSPPGVVWPLAPAQATGAGAASEDWAEPEPERRREWTLMSNINQGLKPEPQPRPQNGSMGTHLKLRIQAGNVKAFYSWNKSRTYVSSEVHHAKLNQWSSD